uniref:Ubiquitin fusion degradation protein 1 homolog n=1 Tax=Rhabditophanes sp. KR3021 TaxID=114890 RepID=A0AC35UBR2_9BILA
MAHHRGLAQLPFASKLRCFSMDNCKLVDDKKAETLSFGGKVLLPSSVLDQLMRTNIEYPMMFKVNSLNPSKQRVTHCGVLEFLAEEGRVYMPSWMMQQLSVGNGELIQISYIQLPKATYAKLKPQSTDFLDITDPRAVLETELSKYCTFTMGDILSFRYNDTEYKLKVVELKPANACCVIECDLNVDFDAPEGYVEPSIQKPSCEMPEAPELPFVKDVVMNSFHGSGCRLDGKEKKKVERCEDPGLLKRTLPEVIVETTYTPGNLSFVRYNYKNRVELTKTLKEESDIKGPEPFSGTGSTTRNRK